MEVAWSRKHRERLPNRVRSSGTQIGRTLEANAAAMVRGGVSARQIAILLVRASFEAAKGESAPDGLKSPVSPPVLCHLPVNRSEPWS